jgi:hypothetical protein
MTKRGKLFAPKDSVILSQIDDNSYEPIDKLLDEPKKELEKTPGLIKDKKEITSGYEYKGKVLAVGPGVENVKVGDIVHHGIHSGAVFSFNGENLVVVQQYQFSAIERFEKESETNV